MNKKLLISLLSVLVLSATVVFADDTTTTNTRPEQPKFENGTLPDFVKVQFQQGQSLQTKGGKGQSSQFGGRRPSQKPDSQPGGKMEPKEWDSSSNNGQGLPPQMNGEQGQNFQGVQLPQFGENTSNGRPPMPPKQNNSTTSSES